MNTKHTHRHKTLKELTINSTYSLEATKFTLLPSPSKQLLEFLHFSIIDEGNHLHQCRRQTIRKERKRCYLEPWARAAEAHDGHSLRRSSIQLEVQQPLGEDHGVALVECRIIDVIGGGGDEAGADAALGDHKELGRGRVGVEGDDTPLSKVEASGGDAEPVDAGELADEGRGHRGLDEVGGVAGDAEAGEDEVGGGDGRLLLADVAGGCKIAGEFCDAEVCGMGGREEEEGKEEEEDGKHYCLILIPVFFIYELLPGERDYIEGPASWMGN